MSPVSVRGANSERIAFGSGALVTLAFLLVGAISPPTTATVAVDFLRWVPVGSWLLRLVLTLGASVCLLLGPGFVLRRFLRAEALWADTAFLWVPGFLYLLTVGVVTWLLAAWVDPHVVASVLVLPVPCAVLAAVRRGPVSGVFSPGERRALAVLALLLLVAVGRATWSSGPEGELLGGSVSRTLEAGNRPDSRIPFVVVQLATHGNSPYSKVGTGYYLPYAFSDRGPIAGLSSVAVVLGSGATPPLVLPDQPWTPFDGQGFAAYRILLMLLGATVVLGAFAILRRFADERLALAGTVIVALCPFVVHETFFTWPKLFSASFGLTALVALFTRRPLLAGSLLGLGYLAHPAGLLVVPGIVLLWLVLLARGAPGICRAPERYPVSRWVRAWLFDAVRLLIGLGTVYLAWRLANDGHVIDRFSSYLYQSDGPERVPFRIWLDGRFQSLGNTLVPLRLYLVDDTNYWVQSYFGPTPDIVRFGFAYSSTLPFAVGLMYYPVYLYGLARFARRAASVFVVAIVLPFVGFVIYWGASLSGVLREGLHFWFVVSVITAFVGHSVIRGGSRLATVVRWTATLRVVSVLFMLAGPAIATRGLFPALQFTPTDVVSIAAMLMGTLGLGWCSWRWLAPAECGMERGIGPAAPTTSRCATVA